MTACRCARKVLQREAAAWIPPMSASVNYHHHRKHQDRLREGSAIIQTPLRTSLLWVRCSVPNYFLEQQRRAHLRKAAQR